MRLLLLGAILGTATLSAQTSLLAPVASAAPKPSAVAPSDIYRSVVRVEVATQVPDYTTPWNSGRFSGGIGTGFLIGKNRFLTNAHVVSNGRRILITVYGSPKKYPARVVFIAHDSDLALLEVEDFTDFAAFPLLKISPGVPQLESQVRVIGYPVGGERLSVTRGVVSRIEFQPYSHSRADSHLVVQIDAAINPGNSGGPVVQGSDVVGVAFQGLRTADNTGYMIPSPVILRFLKDIEDGRYDQYTDLGISDFPLFNPAMRKAFALPDDGLGVLITDVLPTSPADGLVQANDVLLAVDGNPVDSAGQVTLDGESVNMHEIIERKFAGDVVKLSIVRAGERSEVSVKLAPVPASRLYAIQYEKKPRYVVSGGLVFQPLDTNLYASTKLENIHVRRLFGDYVSKGIFRERKDIVVLTRVESDPLTSQLDGFAGLAVDKINGTLVSDLRHLNEILSAASPPEYFVIELFGAPRPLILPSAEIAAANQRVQREGSIPKLFNLED